MQYYIFKALVVSSQFWQENAVLIVYIQSAGKYSIFREIISRIFSLIVMIKYNSITFDTFLESP